MLFTGHSQHSIDAKGRLAIPAKYRNQWDPTRDGAAWFAIPWPTGHLRLYTETMFTELAQHGENTLTPGSEEADLESSLFGFAERLEMDAAGRVALPKSHVELARLGADVVIVGARNRLEVHNRSDWEATAQQRFQQLPDLIKSVQAKKLP